MSYNILNKNVNFQGATQGTIEDIVDTHSTQTIGGLKTVTHLTGTHVRVTNDATVLGNVSASINISASAFYANGVLVNPGGGVTINSAGSNRLTTVASNTSQLDAEINLTFNASTKKLQLGNGLVTDTELVIYGDLSGSGNISGSAFYGNGSNLTGVQPTLKSGGGLNYDSNELEVKIDTLGIPIGGIDTSDDRFLIYDSSASALKIVTPTMVGNLNEPAVSLFNGQTTHRVVTVGGSEQIDGEENLTFDGSTLTIAGDVSGSQVVSGNVGHFVTRVEAGAIALGDATGIAGAGLANNNGEVDIQVTGAVLITSDKVGITGSFAGNGLEYGGGVNSIDGVAIKLESNSGLSVSAAGLKLYANNLTTTTPLASADSLLFIDADDSVTKKMTFNEMTTAIAGNGLDASSGTLVLDLTEVGLAGVANRLLTDDGDGTVTPEANLTFDGDLLTGTNATASFAHYGAGTLTGIGDVQTAYYNASGSGTESFIHFNNKGNLTPLFAIGGVSHPTLPNTITTTAQFKSTAQISSSADISGSALHTTNHSNNPIIMRSIVGTSGSVVALRYKETSFTCGTDNDNDEISGFFEANMIPVALGVRVVSTIGNNAYISKLGTFNDDDSFGTFGDGDLEEAGDNLVTSYHPANATGHNTKWFNGAHELKITYNATPSSGALRFGLYYYSITPPTS